MGKIVSLIGIAVLLLALSGAAEAAIASTGGGLSASLSGAGTSQAASSLSAGHSAEVSRHAHVELAGTGTASQTDSGSDAAIDPENHASVMVDGTTSASLTITGNPAGTAWGTADAIVQASSGQPADGLEEVMTMIATEVNLFARNNLTASGRASASGKAAAAGTMTHLEIKSATQGSSQSSGSVNGRGLGSALDARTYLASDAKGATDGSGGSAWAEIAAMAAVEGTGSGSADASGSGWTTGTSKWSTGAEQTQVSGSVSGKCSFGDPDISGSGQASGTGSLDSERWHAGDYLTGSAATHATNDAFAGSGSFMASGTVRTAYVDTSGTVKEKFDGYLTGDVSGTVTQSGAGKSAILSEIAAFPLDIHGINKFSIEFPTLGYYDTSVPWADMSVDPARQPGIITRIRSSTAVHSDSTAFMSKTTATARGTVIASGSPQAGTEPGIDGEITINGKGSATSSVEAKGESTIEAYSGIFGEAMTGDGTEPIYISGTDTGPGLDISLNPDTAAWSVLYARTDSESATSMVTSSATGSVSARAINRDVPDSSGNTADSFTSTTSAGGSVGGLVRSTTADGEAAAGSAIWGLSAAGTFGTGFPVHDELKDSGMTDTAVLASAAAINPGTATMTAYSFANGNAASSVSGAMIRQGPDSDGNELHDSFTLSSSDSGNLGAYISAKSGSGSSRAMARSGNIAGQVSALTCGLSAVGTTGEFLVESEDADTFGPGIQTDSWGRGYTAYGVVSGNATAAKAVSDDSGSYLREKTDPGSGAVSPVFSMATANHLGDSAKSEFSTKKQNVVMASTDAWAFSQADYDTGAETGPKGYADAWGGYAVSVQATDDAPGTTVRSTVKPVDLSASASTTKTVSASVRMKGGDGLASLETQKLLTAAAAHATFTVSSPLSTGKYRTVNTGTETETGSDPNYAVAYLSLATSSWNIHPIPV